MKILIYNMRWGNQSDGSCVGVSVWKYKRVRTLFILSLGLVFHHKCFILPAVCILPLVCSLRFTLTAFKQGIWQDAARQIRIIPKIHILRMITIFLWRYRSIVVRDPLAM